MFKKSTLTLKQLFDSPFIKYEATVDCKFQIWVAGVDEKLTGNGLISPGLGDTVSDITFSLFLWIIYIIFECQGDRLFNTIRTGNQENLQIRQLLLSVFLVFDSESRYITLKVHPRLVSRFRTNSIREKKQAKKCNGHFISSVFQKQDLRYRAIITSCTHVAMISGSKPYNERPYNSRCLRLQHIYMSNEYVYRGL